MEKLTKGLRKGGGYASGHQSLLFLRQEHESKPGCVERGQNPTVDALRLQNISEIQDKLSDNL